MPPEANPPLQTERERKGAEHHALQGPSQHLWFRPDRLTREDFGDDLVCQVRWNGDPRANYQVLDLAQWGFAFRCDAAHAPLPGTEWPRYSSFASSSPCMTNVGISNPRRSSVKSVSEKASMLPYGSRRRSVPREDDATRLTAAAIAANVRG